MLDLVDQADLEAEVRLNNLLVVEQHLKEIVVVLVDLTVHLEIITELAAEEELVVLDKPVLAHQVEAMAVSDFLIQLLVQEFITQVEAEDLLELIQLLEETKLQHQLQMDLLKAEVVKEQLMMLLVLMEL
jgi:hypothetical protein